MKNFIEEFKKFALKGNVLDMAIGVVVGTAFTNIVNSLVNDIFMPIIAALTGEVQFSELKIVLKGLDENAVTINYGSFIQYLVNFIIIAFCLFLVVKAINKFKDTFDKKEETVEEVKVNEELEALNKIVALLEEDKKADTKKATKKSTKK